jgi:hypothetical protein
VIEGLAGGGEKIFYLAYIPEREAGTLEGPAPQGRRGGGRRLQVLLQQLAKLRQLLTLGGLLALLQAVGVGRLQLTLSEVPVIRPIKFN